MGRRVLLAVVVVLASPAARADDWTDKLQFSGYLSGDIRYQLDDWRGAPGDSQRFEMNRNDLDLKLKVEPDVKVQGVVETRLRFYGFNHAGDIPSLSDRSRVDPFDVRLEEAYLYVKGLIWDKLDLKVGRMVQNWGSADMFNPTDNLSARDFSDPLDYTAKVPNQMIEIDLYPTDWLQITAVWVPLFKPSMLPPSANWGFAVEYDGDGCFVNAPAPPVDTEPHPGQVDDVTGLPISDAKLLEQLFKGDANHVAQVPGFDKARNRNCSLVFPKSEVRTVEPEWSIANSQAAIRAKFRAGDLDLSLSYYYGRFSFPIAYTAVADVVLASKAGAAAMGASTYPYASQLFPTDPKLLDPTKTNVKYVAEVTYPRMQVIGLDFSYSADWLYDVGFVGELALILPEQIDFGLRALIDGKDAIEPMRSVNVPSTPFVKATAGFDYTFTSWLYLNAMYVRGFFDEFNDKYGIHNYFVAATELKFFEDELIIRIAAALNCDDLSANLFPQITWVAAPSVEIQAGVFWLFGDTAMGDPLDYSTRSKFGHKAAGRDFAFFKTKLTW
jgi:hypothetical protein